MPQAVFITDTETWWELPGCPEACTAPSHLKLPAMLQWDHRPQDGFQGMWSVGQCPSGGKDGSAAKRNLVSRLLIHVQFSLTTHFYVITDIWTVTDRAHFENCCVNDSLWFDKSCRDTGSCVAAMVLLREDTAPEMVCLTVCSGFRWAG